MHLKTDEERVLKRTDPGDALLRQAWAGAGCPDRQRAQLQWAAAATERDFRAPDDYTAVASKVWDIKSFLIAAVLVRRCRP